MSEFANIQQTINLYNDTVNRRTWTQFSEVFHENATWETGEPFPFKFNGLKEITEGLSQAVGAASNLMQLNAPALIQIDGDTATARSSFWETAEFLDRGARIDILAHYDDKLLKSAGRWRFLSRKATFVRITETKLG